MMDDAIFRTGSAMMQREGVLVAHAYAADLQPLMTAIYISSFSEKNFSTHWIDNQGEIR